MRRMVDQEAVEKLAGAPIQPHDSQLGRHSNDPATTQYQNIVIIARQTRNLTRTTLETLNLLYAR